MQQKPTILFLNHSPALYGAERCLLELISGLRRYHSDVNIMVLIAQTGPFSDTLETMNVEYFVTPYRGWLGRKQRLLKGSFRALTNLLFINALLKKLQPSSLDVIYTNTLYSPVGAILAKKLGVPHIWHAHEFVHEDMGAEYDFGFPLSMKFINATTDMVLCNSKAVYNKMARHIPLEKLSLVYNGFLEPLDKKRVSVKHGLESSKQVQLCIAGSIAPHKGQIEAVQAVPILADHGLDVKLSIVGTGQADYINEIKHFADRLNVTDRILWEGYRPDVLSVFETSDVALVCSRQEAFGRVVVEAMSVGCPVVATNSGGIPDIIQDGETGLLYQPGNIEMLASKIKTLVQSPMLYESISQNALESVYRRFTIDRYTSEVFSIIKQVLVKDKNRKNLI